MNFHFFTDLVKKPKLTGGQNYNLRLQQIMPEFSAESDTTDTFETDEAWFAKTNMQLDQIRAALPEVSDLVVVDGTSCKIINCSGNIETPMWLSETVMELHQTNADLVALQLGCLDEWFGKPCFEEKRRQFEQSIIDSFNMVYVYNYQYPYHLQNPVSRYHSVTGRYQDRWEDIVDDLKPNQSNLHKVIGLLVHLFIETWCKSKRNPFVVLEETLVNPGRFQLTSRRHIHFVKTLIDADVTHLDTTIDNMLCFGLEEVIDKMPQEHEEIQI